MVSLILPLDEHYLSPYQMLLRSQLELYSSNVRDCASSRQGQRRRVQLGQVGIRCKHCHHVKLVRERGRSSCYYPQTLLGVYQAAQHIATVHLAQSCPCIPQQIRVELCELHQRKYTAAGGRAYWATACSRLGLVDRDDGIFFETGGRVC